MRKMINLVLGSNYGDEGKGQTCYNLSKNYKRCLTVLTNGGCQRGHTVIQDNGTRHVFQHFGSATRSNNDYNYYGRFFILNPIMFKLEYDTLIRKGIITYEYNNIWYNDNCIFTTPFDMMANQIFELSRGDDRHGSTGLGIYATIERYRSMENFNLLDPDIFPSNSFYAFMKFYKEKDGKISYLHRVRNYYLELFKKEGINLKKTDYYQPFMSEFTIEHFITDCYFMYEKTHCDEACGQRLSDYDFKVDSIIYENGQGLLLNSNSDNVHTTPSNTDINNIVKECSDYIRNFASKDYPLEDNPREIDLHIYYITRPYITRHGAGPVDSKELINFTSDDKTNIPNPWQGSIRYYELDINNLKKRLIKSYSFCLKYINSNFNCIPHLVITHNDEMDKTNEFKEAFKDTEWDLIFKENNH